MTRDGYVYFASFKPNFIKVGFSSDPANRVAKMSPRSCKSPRNLVRSSGEIIGVLAGRMDLEKSIQSDLSRWREPYLHEWFTDCRAIRALMLSMNLSPAPAPNKHESSGKEKRCATHLDPRLWLAAKQAAREERIKFSGWLERAIANALPSKFRKALK